MVAALVVRGHLVRAAVRAVIPAPAARVAVMPARAVRAVVVALNNRHSEAVAAVVVSGYLELVRTVPAVRRVLRSVVAGVVVAAVKTAAEVITETRILQAMLAVLVVAAALVITNTHSVRTVLFALFGRATLGNFRRLTSARLKGASYD